MTHPQPSDTCWDLAVSLAAHHCIRRDPATRTAARDIFQVSTISALAVGFLDGDTPYREVIEHGDFGLGTFNALDGEMAALDGTYYHLHSDGTVTEVDPADRTPFAAVTFFRADAEVDVGDPHSRAELLRLLDETVPSENLFYAIRIDGLFSAVTTRTAARQTQPYPRLVDTTRSQVEQTFAGVRGTVLGFRAPQQTQGMTVGGYHLHFIDDSRTVGGHVLDFALAAGIVTLDQDSELHVELPAGDGVTAAELEGADLAAEIQQAEFGAAAD